MFTAERLAQIFLAIVIATTVLVVALKRPVKQEVTITPIFTDSLHTSSPDSLILEKDSIKKEATRAKKKSKHKKKATPPIKQRDHMQEPMDVSEQ